MALIRCPECGRDVSDAADRCPHCGHPIATTSKVGAPPKPSSRWGCAQIGCAGLIGIMIITYVAGSFAASHGAGRASAPDTTWTSDNAVYAAKERCKEYATTRLKAPPTAKWTDMLDSYGKDLGKGLYQVQLTVDAQNSFGAMLRNLVDCRVRRTGSYFTIISFHMGEAG